MSRSGFQTLNLILEQKIPEIHTLFRTTTSILLRCLEKRTIICTPSGLEVIGTDSYENYIPRLGQTHAKLYTLFEKERTKSLRSAAHPHIGHMRDFFRRPHCKMQEGSQPDVTPGAKEEKIS